MGAFLDYVPPPQAVVIVHDGGGIVSKYAEMAQRYALEGRRIEIKGRCASACTLALTTPNVCVHPEAEVAWHQAFTKITHVPLPDVTRDMIAGLPGKLRNYLDGRIQVKYTPETVLHYNELRYLGIPSCDELPYKNPVVKVRTAPMTKEEMEDLRRPYKDKDDEWKTYIAWADKQSKSQYPGGKTTYNCFTNGQCSTTIYYRDNAGMLTSAVEYNKNGRVMDKLVCKAENENSRYVTCKGWYDEATVTYVMNNQGQYVEARN